MILHPEQSDAEVPPNRSNTSRPAGSQQHRNPAAEEQHDFAKEQQQLVGAATKQQKQQIPGTPRSPSPVRWRLLPIEASPQRQRLTRPPRVFLSTPDSGGIHHRATSPSRLLSRRCSCHSLPSSPETPCRRRQPVRRPPATSGRPHRNRGWGSPRPTPPGISPAWRKKVTFRLKVDDNNELWGPAKVTRCQSPIRYS